MPGNRPLTMSTNPPGELPLLTVVRLALMKTVTLPMTKLAARDQIAGMGRTSLTDRDNMIDRKSALLPTIHAGVVITHQDDPFDSIYLLRDSPPLNLRSFIML